MFWMQTGLNALVAICLFVFYWPAKNIEAHRKTMGQIISECDPIGSLLFVMGSTCTLMALNWSSGLYAWSNPHVYATLVVGLVLLIAFGLYGKFGLLGGEIFANLFLTQNGWAGAMGSSPISSSSLDPIFLLRPSPS